MTLDEVRTFLDVTPIPVLFCWSPQVVISAGLSQAWRLLGGPAPPRLDAAALRAWSQPGWIKVAMEFRVEPTAAGTRLSTETRVTATDPRTRRLFAPYWFFIRSGSSAIRRAVLRVTGDREVAARPRPMTSNDHISAPTRFVEADGVRHASAEHAPSVDYANLPDLAEGVVVTMFITVRSIARSRDFYSRVLGGTVVPEENPCLVKLANSWILMNPGGPPTPLDLPSAATCATRTAT